MSGLTEEQEKALEEVRRFLRLNVYGRILVWTEPGDFTKIERTVITKREDIS